MTGTSGWDASHRLLAYRATRALILGVVAMGAAAWLISLPAVVIGLACGLAPALLMGRARALRTPIITTLAAAVAGAVAGSLLLGHGSIAIRTLGALVTSLAVGPWLVVLGFVLWMRARRSPVTPP